MITLKTLASATAQEVYDQVKAHLLVQKCQSIEDGQCKYRGPNGLKCAAGILIGDDEYKEEMDRGVNLAWRDLVKKGLVPDAHSTLICSLQNIHDNLIGDSKLEIRVKRFSC